MVIVAELRSAMTAERENSRRPIRSVRSFSGIQSSGRRYGQEGYPQVRTQDKLEKIESSGGKTRRFRSAKAFTIRKPPSDSEVDSDQAQPFSSNAARVSAIAPDS